MDITAKEVSSGLRPHRGMGTRDTGPGMNPQRSGLQGWFLVHSGAGRVPLGPRTDAQMPVFLPLPGREAQGSSRPFVRMTKGLLACNQLNEFSRVTRLEFVNQH